MKKLLFGEGLMVPTLQGQKRITIRKFRAEAHDFKKGEIVIAEFKDGLNVMIEITADTLVKPFGKINNSEAREDGFRNSDHAFDGLGHFYHDLKREDMAAVIRFKVFEKDNIPVVSTNSNALVVIAAAS